MRKTFMMEELDCANCAAKMEAGIQQIDGVESASISFLTQKLTISAPEDQMDRVLKEAASRIVGFSDRDGLRGKRV